ncbi:hypothetical protein ACFV80_46075 [Streptomyces sp. NPDC059862]
MAVAAASGRVAEPGTIGFGVHFADVVFGHVDEDLWKRPLLLFFLT